MHISGTTLGTSKRLVPTYVLYCYTKRYREWGPTKISIVLFCKNDWKTEKIKLLTFSSQTVFYIIVMHILNVDLWIIFLSLYFKLSSSKNCFTESFWVSITPNFIYIHIYLANKKKNGKTVLLFEYWIISCVYKNRFLCGKRRPRHFYLLNWVSMRDWKRKCWAIGYLIEFQSEHFLKNPRPPVHHWPLFSNNPKSW